MLILLSPAKSLDFETPIPTKKSTLPVFGSATKELAQVAARLSSAELQSLMKISPALAALNVDRFEQLRDDAVNPPTRQAVFAFDGDVYTGLAAKQMASNDIDYLQKHLLILSGLYGILRPLDNIQPYRLEMGSMLANDKAKNLYGFWGTSLTDFVRAYSATMKNQSIVNLASEEYAKAIQFKLLNNPIVTPVFEDYSAGKYKIVSFFAKRARGMMVRYSALNRINHPEKLKAFAVDGYEFCEGASTINGSNQRWVFRRRQ